MVKIGLSNEDGVILKEYYFNNNINDIFDLLKSFIIKNGKENPIYHLNGLSHQCNMLLRVLVGIAIHNYIDYNHQTVIIIESKIANLI